MRALEEHEEPDARRTEQNVGELDPLASPPSAARSPSQSPAHAPTSPRAQLAQRLRDPLVRARIFDRHAAEPIPALEVLLSDASKREDMAAALATLRRQIKLPGQQIVRLVDLLRCQLGQGRLFVQAAYEGSGAVEDTMWLGGVIEISERVAASFLLGPQELGTSILQSVERGDDVIFFTSRDRASLMRASGLTCSELQHTAFLHKELVRELIDPSSLDADIAKRFSSITGPSLSR